LKYLIPAEQRPQGGDEIALLEKTRETMAAKGLGNAKIQISGGDTLVIVTDATDSAGLDSQERIINSALQEQFKAQPENISRELVGPVRKPGDFFHSLGKDRAILSLISQCSILYWNNSN
jgi:hypothetical protein